MTQILYNCFGKTHRQDSRGGKSGLFGNHNDISRLRTVAGDNLVQRSFQDHRPATANRRVLAWYLSGMPPRYRYTSLIAKLVNIFPILAELIPGGIRRQIEDKLCILGRKTGCGHVIVKQRYWELVSICLHCDMTTI